MTTKDYLMQPFKLHKRILRLRRKIEQESEARNKRALRAKEKELIDIYNQKAQDVEGAIAKLKDKRYKDILTRRYLSFQKWDQIALEMAYDYRYVFRLHGYALQKIKFEEK